MLDLRRVHLDTTPIPERMEITQPKVARMASPARTELPWDNRSNAPYPEKVASGGRSSVGGSVKQLKGAGQISSAV